MTRRFSVSGWLEEMRIAQILGDEIGLHRHPVILDDRVDDLGRQDRNVAFERIEDEIGLVGRGEGLGLAQGVFGLFGRQLPAIGENAGQDFGMQGDDEVEHALFAQIEFVAPRRFARIPFLAAVGARCQIPGENADKGRGNGSECANDRRGVFGAHRVSSA